MSATDLQRTIAAVWRIESAKLIGALARLGVSARKAPGRIGIWTDDLTGREAKIGAIGVRVRRWVTLHGFALNLDPDLSHFDAIVPCGIAEYPVTSLAALQRDATPERFDGALAEGFSEFLQSLDRSCKRP